MPMTSIPSFTSGSRKASLSVPSSLSYLFEINKKLPTIIHRVTQEFQQQIRAEARPLWGDVADTINVVYDREDESVHVFSLHPDAQQLEYGGPGSPPYPVLRKAAYSAQLKLADRVSELLYQGAK